MERFHYTITQKLGILNLVRTGQVFQLAQDFPKVTLKQLNEWASKEDEMIQLADRHSKYTLHKGPSIKYKELYQFLFQTVKDWRSERRAVTVDALVGIAENEDESIRNLSSKGKQSLIRRFMSHFNLSIREITGTSGFREEQASEEQRELRDSFIRHFKRIIVDKLIPIENIFNMDQTGILYENRPSRTIDFIGSREVPVQTQGNDKKRITLYSLLNATGELYPQMLVFKGVRDARIHEEVKEYDEWYSRHTCQENAWCDGENLLEWICLLWHSIACTTPGPKLLLLDSYPLHLDFLEKLSKYDTEVLYIPAGMTFTLQPLDQGFHKVLKDELKKIWVASQGQGSETEKEKRKALALAVKDVWLTMTDKDNKVYWGKAGLEYPDEDVIFRRNRIQAQELLARMEEEEIPQEAQQDPEMDIETQ